MAVAVNFSELLDANRLRPLWGPGQPQPAEEAKEQQGKKSSLDGEEDAADKAARDAKEDPLRDAPLQIMPKESPSQLLNKLESVLRMLLGPQAMMLTIYLAPLRNAIYDIEGVQRIPHPLQHAIKTNNLPMLIYRLEDSIRALLRSKQRYLG